MTDWDPKLYLAFEAERTRPAIDLLAQVPLNAIKAAVDLGCGPGNSTQLLAARFGHAAVSGIDNSDAMVESARARLPDCRFHVADIAAWRPAVPPDLLYANAALQWLPDHETLIPQLFGLLAPGGVLAIQMPDNHEEPSHRLMRETQAELGGAAAPVTTPRVKVLPLKSYYDMLSVAGRVNVWRTVYQHPMPSAAAIVEWLRSTGLRPFLSPLSEAQQRQFLARYEERLVEAYPPQRDGNLLLAFPRIFIVAQK